MGIDFITSKRRGFRKMFDGGRSALDTADLLVVDQLWEDQSVLFEVHDGVTLIEGEELTVQVSEPALVALRGYEIVATATKPPAAVLAAMRRAHGFAVGRVVRYSAVSRTADIAFRLERG